MKPLDARTRSLIDDALAADVPPPQLEARLWETLATRLDAPLPPTAAAAHGALATKGVLTGASALWLKVMAGVIAVGAGGVGVHAVMRHEPLPAAHPTATTQPSAALPAPSPAIATEPPPMPPQPSAAPAMTPTTPTANRSLQAETALLARAQRALGAGTPAAALPWIQQHAARFPNGSLAQEREAARVLALCALERANEAHSAIQRFLRTWPTSPLADRVRAACTAR